MRDDELKRTFCNDDADLICVGHTHCPAERHIQGKVLFNVGSVSNAFPPDLRASYAILRADSSGHTITHYRVDYDRDAVIAELEHARFPARNYVKRFMRGEITPSWGGA